MRARTLLLLLFAVVLAGGTAFLTSTWLKNQRQQGLAEGPPMALPTPAKSVLVARADIRRGQILRPDEMVWQTWPEGDLNKNYVEMGGPRTPEAFAGWVAKNPITGGEPITESKIIAPGNRGFLAAVLRPGMRAISVPVTVTSGIAGFIFPGDQVDLLLTYTVPAPEKRDGDKGEKYQHKAAETVLRDIRVIAIDQRLESKPGEAVPAHTATFEVTARQSEVIVLTTEIGKLSLTLRSLVPGADAGAEPTSGNPAVTDPHAAAPSDPVRMAALTAPAAGAPTVVSARTSGSSSAAAANSAQVSVVSGRPTGLAQATPPSGAVRLVTPPADPGNSTTGANATYTLDHEISKLLPQPKGEKEETAEPPKLWVCKGPALSCSNPASGSPGDQYLAASQQADRALGEMARQKAIASGGK